MHLKRVVDDEEMWDDVLREVGMALFKELADVKKHVDKLLVEMPSLKPQERARIASSATQYDPREVRRSRARVSWEDMRGDGGVAMGGSPAGGQSLAGLVLWPNPTI